MGETYPVAGMLAERSSDLETDSPIPAAEQTRPEIPPWASPAAQSAGQRLEIRHWMDGPFYQGVPAPAS